MENTKLLLSANLEGSGGTIDTADTDVNLTEQLLSSLELSDYAYIEDMLYQDGCVFLLLSENENDTYEKKFYSRGCLIKYDTWTGEISHLGFSSDKKEITDLPAIKLNAYYSEDRNQLFVDEECTTPVVITTSIYTDMYGTAGQNLYAEIPSFYTPAPLDKNLSTSAFYGPKKFLAIKPKKLVIADVGVAFYTDSDGNFFHKNVNRIVTVDLEKFAITDITDTKVKFRTSSTYKFGLDVPSAELSTLWEDNDYRKEPGDTVKFYYLSSGSKQEYTMGTIYVGIMPEADE